MSGRVVQKETQLERGTGPKEAKVRFKRRLNFSLKKGPRTGLKNVWWGLVCLEQRHSRGVECGGEFRKVTHGRA